jgi:hypothetical protein
MLWVFTTDDHDDAMSPDHFTVIATWLDRCTNFHDSPPQYAQNSRSQGGIFAAGSTTLLLFYPIWLSKNDARLKDQKSEREETTNLTISHAM